MKRGACKIVAIALLLLLVLLVAPAAPKTAKAAESYELAGYTSSHADPGALGYSGWLAIGCVLLLVCVPAATIHLVRRHREQGRLREGSARKAQPGRPVVRPNWSHSVRR